MKKYLVTIVGALIANTSLTISSENQTIKQQIGNLYVLGDSLSDTGNFAEAGSEFFKNDGFPLVNKITMTAPFYENSFSNGPVAIQVAANQLGYELTNGYRFVDSKGITHEKIGNNYAYAGSQAGYRDDWAGTKFLNHFNLTVQTDALLSQHQLNCDDKILIEIGTNDIIYAVSKLFSSSRYAAIDNALSNEELNIEKIYNAGARHIILPDIFDATKAPIFNRAVLLHSRISKLVNYYNIGLKQIIARFNEKYNANIISSVDSNKLMNLSLSLFAETKGHNIKDNIYIINYLSTVFDGYLKPYFNPFINRNHLENYFWFDLLHPGAWAHNFLGEQLVPIIENA